MLSLYAVNNPSVNPRETSIFKMKNTTHTITKKKRYSSPMIHEYFLQLEGSVAAGSAIVSPTNNAQEVYHEWEKEADVSGNYDW